MSIDNFELLAFWKSMKSSKTFIRYLYKITIMHPHKLNNFNRITRFSVKIYCQTLALFTSYNIMQNFKLLDIQQESILLFLLHFKFQHRKLQNASLNVLSSHKLDLSWNILYFKLLPRIHNLFQKYYGFTLT